MHIFNQIVRSFGILIARLYFTSIIYFVLRINVHDKICVIIINKIKLESALDLKMLINVWSLVLENV